ncbi:MAG: hypothetical protein DWQ05_01175 [Calditrichaeota bacterium]|nr:MAG: hypothetical protein DWQ05_01175 [Calditrichota bacterium]
MKVYLRIILYPVVLFLLFLRYSPLPIVRPVARFLPDFIIENFRPEARAITTVTSYPPEAVKLVMPQSKWLNVREKQRKLVSKFKYESLRAEQDIVQLNDLYFLRAGGDFLATYHRRNHEILILSPELKVVKMWPMQLRNGVKIDAPIDLAIKDEEIYAIDRAGLVASWNLNGVEQSHFTAPFNARDIDIFENGDFLMHHTGNLPWLLSRVDADGVLKSRFAPHAIQDSTEARFMLHSILAIDRSNDLICLAYKSPYKLFFYNTVGKPLTALEIVPNFQVAEPIVTRKDKEITQVGYQKVIFEVEWHDGLLWALVSSEMGKAPQWLETYNVAGEFLQRFALLDGVSRFAFLQNRLVVLGYAPNFRIESYDITPLDAH